MIYFNIVFLLIGWASTQNSTEILSTILTIEESTSTNPFTSTNLVTSTTAILLSTSTSALGPFSSIPPSIPIPPSVPSSVPPSIPAVIPAIIPPTSSIFVPSSAPPTQPTIPTTPFNPDPPGTTIILPTSIVIVTVIGGQSSTLTSTSTPSAQAEIESSYSSNSTFLYIFLGVVGAVILGGCIIYAFRCLSLSPSEPFRKRLNNTEAIDSMINESNTSWSRHKKNGSYEHATYPGGFFSNHPSILQPIRYNESSSTLGSLSSHPRSLIYPSLPISKGVENTEDLNYYQHCPQFSSADPFYDVHNEYHSYQPSVMPVLCDDGRIEYYHAHTAPGPYYPVLAAAQSVPVIVRVGSVESNLDQHSSDSTALL